MTFLVAFNIYIDLWLGMESVVRLLHKMSIEEEKYAKELEELSQMFKHPLLQSLINGIAFDSLKHSVFYRALADLISTGSPMITEEECSVIKKRY